MHPHTQRIESESARGLSAASADCGHSVHFYENDSALLESLSEFAGAALGAGGSAIVIATRTHRRGLADLLKDSGIDLQLATDNKRYIALDAEETLARFTPGGGRTRLSSARSLNRNCRQPGRAGYGKRLLSWPSERWLPCSGQTANARPLFGSSNFGMSWRETALSPCGAPTRLEPSGTIPRANSFAKCAPNTPM